MARVEVDYVALKKKYPRFGIDEVFFQCFFYTQCFRFPHILCFPFCLQLKKFKEDFDLFDADISDDINAKELQVLGFPTLSSNYFLLFQGILNHLPGHLQKARRKGSF